MRFTMLLLVIMLIPAFAFARDSEGGGGSGDRVRLSGFYGYGSQTSSDVNNFINATNSNPKENNLTSFWFYGGEFGYRLHPRWELQIEYDQMYSKNPVTTNLGQNSGVEMAMNDVMAGFRSKA